MPFQTKKYKRRPFEVDAVRVTEENIDALAMWCEGRVRQGDPRGELEKFIYLQKIHTPMNERQKMAFVDDWVLKTDKGFKFYTDQAFHKMFEPLHLDSELVEKHLGDDDD